MVTVYVDILIILNAFVNLFILLVTSLFLKQRAAILRMVAASFVGALFSLYIFLPSGSFLIELLLRLVCAGVTVAVCFGFGGFIRFIRLCAVFYAVSFMYAGVMLAVFVLCKPKSMAINNGVVYLSISPLLLIGVTLFAYVLLTVIQKISVKNGAAGKTCKLKVRLDDTEIGLNALIDTGHSLKDIMSTSPVIVIDKKVLVSLLGKDRSESFLCEDFDSIKDLAERYRAIPCTTVSGTVMLKAIRCDCLYVYNGDRVFKLTSPILAVSATSVGGDYDAIAGTDILQVIV